MTEARSSGNLWRTARGGAFRLASSLGAADAARGVFFLRERGRAAGGAQRLRLLASIAIDGHGFESQFPCLKIGLHDVFHGGVVRQVYGLGYRAGDERLRGRHHFQMAHIMDGTRSLAGLERAVENGEMLVLHMGRAFDGAGRVDVADDGVGLLVRVGKLEQRRRDRLLTILIMPPPTSFLYFTSARSGSMPVVSQSIMKPMVPVGARTVTWALR